jgi:branched-chain amino acid transport system ATP-binding protein
MSAPGAVNAANAMSGTKDTSTANSAAATNASNAAYATDPTSPATRFTTAAVLLEVQDLSVRFGNLHAVSGVSFNALRGHITSVIGPNGAGKSTLFNLISGAIAPSGGQVRFDGENITGVAPHRLTRKGLSRSFQITNLFPELPVYENLRLAAQVLELPALLAMPLRRSQKARERADELIERFALKDKAHELAGTLSHGEQRRLEIAVALASRPKMLLLDEPTQGMSHADTEDTANLIRQLSSEITILLVEHDVGLVMNLSDHVVVMNQGKKLAEGTPLEVRANPAVQAAYFGSGVAHA